MAVRNAHFAAAIYDSHADAAHAIRALIRSGLDMATTSIAGRDFQTDDRALGFYTLGDRVCFCGGRGRFWSGLWSVLDGGALFIAPPGALLVMGPLVGAIAAGLPGVQQSAVHALIAAMRAAGMPLGTSNRYGGEVQVGKFLLLTRGSAEAASHTRRVLGLTGASQLVASSPIARAVERHP